MSQHQQEKLPDLSDRATELEMMHTEDCIRDARKWAEQDQAPDGDGVYAILLCADCDNEIGEGRLKHAPRNLICIHCATRRERKR